MIVHQTDVNSANCQILFFCGYYNKYVGKHTWQLSL